MKKLSIFGIGVLILTLLAGCSAVQETGTLNEHRAPGDNQPAAQEAVDSAQDSMGGESSGLADRITAEEAKEIALTRAGVAGDNLTRYTCELDYDDETKRWEYELEFAVGSIEYEVEISAADGQVLHFEKEKKTPPSTVTTTESVVSSQQTTITAMDTTTTQKSTDKSRNLIGKDEAKRIALERAGVAEKNVTEMEIELDYDDDDRRWEYELEFRVGRVEYDIVIHAQTGKVIQMDKDEDEEKTAVITTKTSKKATISREKAKAIALERAGVAEKNVTEMEIELDYDDDDRRWEYELEFRVGRVEYEITVDGVTGEVLEFEKDED